VSESVRAGDVLLEQRPLERVELDVARGTATLCCSGATLRFEGIAATTLLGPWDGARGVVEHATVVAVEAGQVCVEVRVRFATVPRVYRVVCARVSRGAAGQRIVGARKRTT
jgi:hypothetical protein